MPLNKPYCLFRPFLPTDVYNNLFKVLKNLYILSFTEIILNNQVIKKNQGYIQNKVQMKNVTHSFIKV